MTTILKIAIVSLPIFCNAACPDGQYLPKNGTCKPCDKECIGGQIKIAACTKEENIRCECPNGYYFISLKHSCFKCKEAGAGERYTRNCSKFDNSLVEPCPMKTYTDDNNVCKNCTECPFGYIVEQNCSRSHDFICKKRDENDDGDSSLGLILGILLPIICLILGGIVIAIEIKRRSRASQAAGDGKVSDAPGSFNHSVNSLAITLEKQANGNYLEQLKKPDPPKHKEKHADYHRASSQISQTSVANGAINPLTDSNGGAIKLDDIAERSINVSNLKWKHTSIDMLGFNSRSALSKILSLPTSNNWRCLADKLSFSCNDIDLLDLHKEPVMQLLREYGCKRNPSIPALYAALVEMGRSDACRIIIEDYIVKDDQV